MGPKKPGFSKKPGFLFSATPLVPEEASGNAGRADDLSLSSFDDDIPLEEGRATSTRIQFGGHPPAGSLCPSLRLLSIVKQPHHIPLLLTQDAHRRPPQEDVSPRASKFLPLRRA